MKRVMTFAFVTMITIPVFAADKKNAVPEQAAPVYAYVKAILNDDVESFKTAHSIRALKAYKQMGGTEKLFKQFKSVFSAKFKDAKLSDFSFTAKKQKYATPGGQLELDGEYYMVMMNVDKIGGHGVFVEKENGNWKITIPRYKNLDKVMKKAKGNKENPED